ncbi:MAG: PAS domain S-box protein [Sedimentisphaerales bacterium]|nr:PAS domain S-box protein [Sedimentisphaerales bacterium]
MKEVHTQAEEIDGYLHNHSVLGTVRTLGMASDNIMECLRGNLSCEDQFLTDELERIRQSCEAAIVYVMDTDGLVVASTTYGPDNSETLRGNNYSFRPYFTQALQGHDVVYPALGITTNKRGIYYSSPVYCICSGDCFNKIIGVTVVKIPLEKVDSILAATDHPAVLVSPLGNVFSASDPDWIFKQVFSAFSEVSGTLPNNPMDFNDPLPLGFDLNQTRLFIKDREHMVERMDLHLADETGPWKLFVLAPTADYYSAWDLCLPGLAVLLLHVFIAFVWIYKKSTGQAQCALREREQWYRVLFESSDNATFIMSQNKFIECNERTLDIFGVTREQILGYGPGRFSPEFQPNGIRSSEMAAHYLSRATDGERLRFEWRHTRLDGNEFDAEVTLNRVDLSGKIFIQAAVRNITDQKKAEQIRLEHSRHLKQIINASPVPTLVLDKNHRVTHWNKAIMNLTGIPVGEIVGTDQHWAAFYRQSRPILADLILNETSEKDISNIYGEQLRVSSIAEGAYETEAFFPDMGSKGRWLFFTAVPLKDMEGQIIGAIEMLQDITDRKHYEEDLHRAKEDVADAWAHTEAVNRKLELAAEQSRIMAKEAIQASKSKSEFLANMSHEIRTPMNAIIGFSDVLAEEDLNEDQRQYVETIRNSGEHLLGIINDILDFSKIEAGKLETEIMECSLWSLIDQAESLIRSAAEAKGLEFHVHRASDLPAQIWTDPARVRQCLVNLLGNAVKFTEQGSVSLDVQMERTEKVSFLRFDVKDTGVGIAEDKLSGIFEAFSQADTSHSRQFGGTGLGLTITRQLAQLLGGSVSVESHVGEGTTFTLRIPTNAGLDKPSFPQADSECGDDLCAVRIQVEELTRVFDSVSHAQTDGSPAQDPCPVSSEENRSKETSDAGLNQAT